MMHAYVSASASGWLAAPFVVVTASWRALNWLQGCRQRARIAGEVLRVADEVARLASLVQGELASLEWHPRGAWYRVQCETLRARADLALENAPRVRRLSAGRLARALSRLHNDLRKLRDCRDELLVAVSLWNCDAGRAAGHGDGPGHPPLAADAAGVAA